MIITDIFPTSLTEGSQIVKVFGDTVELIADPTSRQLKTMLKACHLVRGIEHGGTIWIWDGYDAAHRQVQLSLKLIPVDCAEFAMRPDAMSGYVEMFYFRHKERLQSDQNFLTLVKGIPLL